MLGIFKNMFASTGNSELKEAVKNGTILVDVRMPDEFSTGSVKGAVNIPLDKLPGQLSKFERNKSIVVFCRSGIRSSRAKSILERNGFHNVLNGRSWQNVNQLVKQKNG